MEGLAASNPGLYGAWMRKLSTFAAAAVAGLVLAGLALAGCASGQARKAAPQNALAGVSFFVDPGSPAAQQAAEWRSQGRLADAAAMARIASQPTATWLTGGEDVEASVRALTKRAALAHQSALLVAYDVPGRDCSGYSAGGARSGLEYRAWISRLAAGIGGRRATVILEPDAIAQTLSRCLSASAVAERYALLSYAVTQLKAHRQATVYVDAGNIGWIRPAARLAGPLRRAGVARADGFALNVSNFYGSSDTTSYGRALAAVLGGAHFVIDTGRNGNGPDVHAADGPAWCNPPGRALGHQPTTDTGIAMVDAYLWIKQPGFSDGSCRPGEPPAGGWWPEYALALAR
jgi:endoglucanase